MCSQRSGGSTGELYFPLEIPAGAYRGVDQPVSVVGVANVLVVNRSMPDDLAYDITRVLFEKKSELAAIHPEAAQLSRERGGERVASRVSSWCAPVLRRAEGQSMNTLIRLESTMPGECPQAWASLRRLLRTC